MIFTNHLVEIEALSGCQTVISDRETREKLPLCRYIYVNCQCGLLHQVTIVALSLYFLPLRTFWTLILQKPKLECKKERLKHGYEKAENYSIDILILSGSFCNFPRMFLSSQSAPIDSQKERPSHG